MSATRRLSSPTFWSAVVACLGMAASTSGAIRESSMVGLTERPRGRLECPGEGPHVRFMVDSGKRQKSITVTHVPLSEPITNIPEYHDCQNFITQDMQYDSLFGIFAAFRLHDRLAPDTIQASPDSVSLHELKAPAIAAATIFSASLHTYEPLGIHRGFNCLFVFHPSAADTSDWRATMVPLVPPDSDCTRPGIELSPGKVLLVKASAMPGAQLRDYPETARWDWDSTTRTQYIGIACRENWCEIGDPAGFTPSSAVAPITFGPIPSVALTGVEAQRVFGIKGWYDSQILARRTTAGLVPSGVSGIVIPNPGLAQILKPWLISGAGAPIPPTSMQPYEDRWINVSATIVSAPYKGLRPGGPNMLYFCYGSESSCNIPPVHQTPPQWTPTSDCNSGTAAPKRWFAKLGFQDFTIGYGCVVVTDHWYSLWQWKKVHSSSWTIALPATARWHWLITDDLAGWTGCYQTSCCKN